MTARGDRRRFNRRERAALYLAADGKCEKCGRPLPPSWHGDHVDPYVHGGPTDVFNGQALCPPCNLEKGATVSLPMRQFQLEAINEYHRRDMQDFLIEATPGSGKTRVAVTIAKKLIDDRDIDQVVVVVPTDALRLQWADASAPGLQLRPYRSGDGLIKMAGYDGIVVTYQQLGTGGTADLIRLETRRNKYLGIFDEIHHAGDSQSWAIGLNHAFEHATRRLALTGTPWRSDNNPIPFVRYNEADVVDPNFQYGYGNAVADGVCRPISFESYTGDVRWADCGSIIETQVGADLSDEDTGKALDTLYRPEQVWIPALLKMANESLTEMRRVDVPDAGGLVIADQKWHAKAYAQLIHEITGVAPTLVISEGPNNADAKGKLDAFRKDGSPWLVAVRMVSEGIDIPRLSVGVYAAKTTTPLFFRQVVGRFVRVREGEAHNAQLFMPAVPVFNRHALEIEQELRHAREEQEEQERRRLKDVENLQETFNLRVPLSTSEPTFDRTIHRGEEFGELDLNDALAFCANATIPANFAANVASELRKRRMTVLGVDVTVAPAPDPEPQHRLRTSRMQEIERHARKLDRLIEGRKPGDTNRELVGKWRASRRNLTDEQLVDQIDYLLGKLSEQSRR